MGAGQGPDGGRIRAGWQRAKTAAAYIGAAFSTAGYPHKNITLKDLRFLFQFVKPVWKLGLATLVLVVLIAALQSIVPLNTKFFIDYVINQDSTAGVASTMAGLGLGFLAPLVTTVMSDLIALILFMIALTVSYAALEMLQSFLTVKYQQELVVSVQVKLFERVLRFPMSFLKNKQTGYLLSRISDDVNAIQYIFSAAALFLAQNALNLVFSFAILFTINFELTLIALLVTPVYLAINYYFGRRLRAISYKERESYAKVSQGIQEALSGVEVIKSYTSEEREVSKIRTRIQDVAEARVVTTILNSAAQFSMRATQFVFTLVIMWFGYQEIRQGSLTIGGYVTFTTYSIMLSSAINNVFSGYLSMLRVFVSVERLMEMFDIVPEQDEDRESRGLLRPEAVAGEIAYDDVAFAYEKDTPVLTGVSFQVPPGGSVTIVGPSGSGKSTIVNLLLKFYQPRSGAIRLDGTDIARIDRKWLREQIGIVSQDIFLFNETVENNIKYGQQDATHEAVEAAARKAHIHDEIMKFPQGYATIIGEKGVKLSVGQRQRISIARAFLKGTPILVLDEPTSSIDTATEDLIRTSLRELMKGKTTIIISHRMSFANLSDRVLVLENGKVAQYGSHDDLLAREGLYHSLYFREKTGEGQNVI